MKPIDITGKKVLVKSGYLEVRTAPKELKHWPYLSWLLSPRHDGEPGMLYLNAEKGEILSVSDDAEYTIEDIPE